MNAAQISHDRNCPCDECRASGTGAWALTCEVEGCAENATTTCIYTSARGKPCGKRVCTKHVERLFTSPYCTEHARKRRRA